MKKIFYIPVSIGLPVVTLVNGFWPLPAETVEARCLGAYQSQCVAKVPRPLNAPNVPEYKMGTSVTSTAVTSTFTVSAVTANFEA